MSIVSLQVQGEWKLECTEVSLITRPPQSKYTDLITNSFTFYLFVFFNSLFIIEPCSCSYFPSVSFRLRQVHLPKPRSRTDDGGCFRRNFSFFVDSELTKNEEHLYGDVADNGAPGGGFQVVVCGETHVVRDGDGDVKSGEEDHPIP